MLMGMLLKNKRTQDRWKPIDQQPDRDRVAAAKFNLKL